MMRESIDGLAGVNCHFQNSSVRKLKPNVLFVVLNRCIAEVLLI